MDNSEYKKTVNIFILYIISVIVLFSVALITQIDFAYNLLQKKSVKVVTLTEDVEYVFDLPKKATAIKQTKTDDVSFEESTDLPPIKLIDVPYINQKTKCPTGCEAVSAVMAMRYFDYKISGKYFINHFLDLAPAPYVDSMGQNMGYDPRDYFLGNPFSNEGWGCKAEAIENALNKCIDHNRHSIINITGTSLTDLRSYIDSDIPVIIWATQGMQKARRSKSWTIVDKNEIYTWIAPNHCLLMTGYDYTGYYFNDPLLHKHTRFPADIVEDRYNSMGKEAIIITKTAN